MRRTRWLRSLIVFLVLVIGLVVVVAAATPSTQAASPFFVDVTGSHPYLEAIEGLAQQGIIGGYERSDGQAEFRPGNSVLRAQFAKIIVGALDLDVENPPDSPFTDLGPASSGDPHYPTDYVARAYAEGIVKGFSATTFGPYEPIRRAQLITMVVRGAQQLRPGSFTNPPAGFRSYIGDFDPTHGPTLRIAEYNGLLDGLQGYGWGWDPWVIATRGEAAQILWNLMDPPGPGSTTTLPPTTTTTTVPAVGTTVANVAAWVSDASPVQYSNVTAYAKATDSSGRVVPGAAVTFTWKYKTITHTMSATTNSSGVASVTRNISGATKGFKVVISINASRGGGSASASTSFTPR